MNSSMVKKIVAIVIAALLSVIVMPVLVAYAVTHTFQVVETQPVSLYLGLSSTATSMVVTPVPTDLDGTILTMASFGSTPTVTVDPGISGSEEIVNFTSLTNNGNGTATLGGLTRDLLSQYPFTVGSGGKPHPAGSLVVFSNNPQIYNRLAAWENDGTITGLWSFTLPPTSVTPTTTTQLATKGYVDSVAVAGAPNADTLTKGIVQIATAKQAASSTGFGSTGAIDVLASSYSTDTPSIVCSNGSGGCNVMSLLNGKLSQSWIDFTQLFSFTGGLISTGSSTLVGTSTFVGTTTSVGAAVDYAYEHNYLASTTITAEKAVFISTSTGAVQISDGSADNTAYFDGFAKTSGTNGNPVLVQESGVVTGLSGLATGTTYYLGSTGALTGSPAAAAVPAGVALSATSLLIGKSADNYIMSATGNNTCNSTTCTVTIAIPADWKKAIVQGSFNGTIELAGQVTLYEFGPTLATITAGLGNSSGNGSISISESVNAITLTSSLSGSENHQITGTVYLFR